ncbi:hypothetical protein N7493_006539 [Penicillium malachiteum]|uniref:Amino acid/polyamine transporter I n=1 Tax=Penicillium malachiteum TaxID=1324776 RepID=A0AAD6HL53_9EURO|nr:hypothetical protein N7493_006539 [Penicillium malachiteum]
MSESQMGESSRAAELGASHYGSGHSDRMPKQFTLWSLLAFAIAVCSAWIATSSLLSTHLTFGGFAAATWIPIASGFVSIFPALGLAELASAYPSSGGQYHYAFMVANPRYKNLAAFSVAWFAILEWLFVVCSTTIYPAQLTAEIAFLWHPEYDCTRWQIYLIYVALLLLGTCMIIFCHRWMPRIETLFCWSSLLAFGTFVLTLAAASPTKQPASTVFAGWKNSSGWSDGMSFLLDVGQGMWIYVCLDAATHLSEEIDKPEIHVPRSIILATVLALVCNVAFTLSALFSVKSIATVMSSSLPIYEVLRQAIPSEGAVLFLLIWLDLVFISTVPGALLTTGRLVWAFARDGGLPYSPFSVASAVAMKYQLSFAALMLIGSLWWGAGKNGTFTGPIMVGNVLQGIEPRPVDGTTISPSKGWDQDESD